MSFEEQAEDVLFPNAFRAGIISEDGADFFILEFGNAPEETDLEEPEVEPKICVALPPDSLKILLRQIVDIGMRYKSDFWENILTSDSEPNGGDEHGEA